MPSAISCSMMAKRPVLMVVLPSHVEPPGYPPRWRRRSCLPAVAGQWVFSGWSVLVSGWSFRWVEAPLPKPVLQDLHHLLSRQVGIGRGTTGDERVVDDDGGGLAEVAVVLPAGGGRVAKDVF